MNDDREDRIRARAHAIWVAEGRPEGREREHWHLAERELFPDPFRSKGDDQSTIATDAAGTIAAFGRRS